MKTKKNYSERLDGLVKMKSTINTHIDYAKKFKSLMEVSDQWLRLKSINDSFSNGEGVFQNQLLGDAMSYPITVILAFNKENLRTIDDEVVKSIVEIVDKDYAAFSFASEIDEDILSKILLRKMDAGEYYEYLSGKKIIAVREDKKYFIKKPENFESMIKEYNKSHGGGFDPEWNYQIKNNLVDPMKNASPVRENVTYVG